MKKNFAKIILIFCLCMFSTGTLVSAAGDNTLTGDILIPPPQEAKLPIIMYHLVTENQKYIGKYGITPQQLESDLQYLAENNYHTVVVADILAFVQEGTPLPDNPIMLTFDDGNYSDYQYLQPLLEKYHMKAVAAIIGEAADRCHAILEKTPKAKVPNMGWDQIAALHNAGNIEIQSHGYNVHGANGSGNKKGEGSEAYYTRLHTDLQKFQDLCTEKIGHTPTAFIYPLGIVGKGSQKIIEDVGIQVTLGCEEGMNVLTPGSKEALFKMHRYNRPSNRSIGDILKSIK